MLQLLLLYSYILSAFASVSVFLDTDGNDTISCITSSSKMFPCKTLQYAVNHRSNDTSFVLLSDVRLSTIANFTLCRNIMISAEENKQLLCDCKLHSSCGLLFENCENVTLKNVTVKDCSVPLNSSYHTPLLLRGGVVVKGGSGITTLSHLVATENQGYGVIVLNTGGTINFFNSSFINNSLELPEELPDCGGGGMYIIVSCNDNTVCYAGDTQYNIINCKFRGNHPRWNRTMFSHTVWIASYGGGLNIFLSLNAVNNMFHIHNCVFEHNKALFGGGLFIGCEAGCINNTVAIHDCILKQNSVSERYGGGGGGAIGITSLTQDIPYNNSITFQNSTFYKNNCSAGYGGGILVYGGKQFFSSPFMITNEVTFINCTWTNNTGAISSAVDLSPDFRYQDDTNFIVTATFTGCTFQRNHMNTYPVTYDEISEEILNKYYYDTPVIPIQQYKHNGVFLVTKIDVFFTETNQFLNNTGTALYLCSARAYFREYSDTYFTGNIGLYGGAMALYGFSRINYNDNVAFHFNANSADQGGGIFVYNIDQHLVFASYTCFLSHVVNKTTVFLKPNNVTFDFSANKANYDASCSMYLSSFVQACLDTCELMFDGINTSVHQVFRSNSCFGNFTYDSPNQVAADGFMAVLVKQNLTFTPGIISALPIDVYDMFGNNVTNITIYSAKLKLHDTCDGNASIDPSYTSSPMNYIRIFGYPEAQCTLILTLLGYLDTQIEVDFTLSLCRPGYVIVDHADPRSAKCVCSAVLTKSYHYHGINLCNSTIHAAILAPGMWIGYENVSEPRQDSLYTAICPTGYCKNDVEELAFSSSILSEHICNTNRTDFLCGRCHHGTSAVFSDYDTDLCVSDSECQFGVLCYIGLELLPISIIFIIIILSSISLTGGVAYSMLFIVQMLFSINFTINGVSKLDVFQFIDYLYGIADLHIPLSVYMYCLWAGSTTLDVLVMKYVSIVYAMGLVVCTVLLFNFFNCGRLNRCLRCRNRQYSIVHGLSAFMVICYSVCARVTFKILSMSSTRNMGSQNTKIVAFYAGHIDYLSPQHLPYAIPAILMAIFVVALFPLLLFLDPFLLKFGGFLVKHGVLKTCLPWTQFRMKFKPFFDSFQGCFRDDARYFAGLFFIYRAAIHLTSTIVQTKSHFYVYLEMLLFLMLTIQAIVQPFENKWHNILSSCMFFVFLSINSLTIINYLFVVHKVSKTKILVILWFEMIMALVPLMFGIAMCGKWLFKKILKWKQNSKHIDYEISLRRESFHYGSVTLDNPAVVSTLSTGN